MKRAVSVSIGSSKRDKAVEVNLLGEKISIERIGTDGDMEAAALKYQELDGTGRCLRRRRRRPGRAGGWGVLPLPFGQAHGALHRENASGGWWRLEEHPRE